MSENEDDEEDLFDALEEVLQPVSSADDGPDPLDEVMGFEPGALPVGPDGSVVGVALPPLTFTPATPEHFTCLRGPCRHYMELKGPAPSLTRGYAPPTRTTRFCHRMPGAYIPLSNETIAKCNAWDPLQPSELEELDARREDYYARNPEHRPGLNGNGKEHASG